MNLSAFQVDDHLVIRVNIEPAGSLAGNPINIGLLIDVSGSMDGVRIDAVKRTLHAARGLWRAEDRVTLVTFSDRAQVLRDHQRMDEAGLTEFYSAVDAMRADGSTNLSAGIEALYGCGADYDMVLILTDGVVNAGVTSAAGLEAMLNAPGRRTINTYGYGADHCRALLRDLALRSRGAYTFIDNDEILPVATGDLISGLREEVARGATLTVPEGWTCAELDGGANAFYVGNLVGGRDYWYVFRRGAAAAGAATAPIRLTAPGGAEAEISVVFADEAPEAREQILRCRVARLMSQMSEALEAGLSLPREAATALKAEIDAAAAEFRARPLVLRLQGQLAELLAMPEAPPPPAMGPMLGLARGGGGGLGRSPAGAMWPGTPAGGTRSLAARLASGMTCLSNQRGVYTGVSESGTSVYEEDPDRSVSLFSTPSQRSASSQVRDVYSGAASGPPIAPVPAPAPAGDPHALPITPQSSQEPDA